MTAELAPETTRRIELADAAATESLARALARAAGPGDVIALWGDLGAGKTHFARAFIGALSRPRDGTAESDPNDGGEEVPSPTFTLVQTYDTAAGTVWHFDLYRLESPEEVLELGFDDALADGILLIEWPDRLGDLLPGDRLDLVLEFGADGERRRARLTGHGGWTARLQSVALPLAPS